VRRRPGNNTAQEPGFKPADLEFINATVRHFMADVTDNWRKTQ
jgi:hypothetical protein